MAGGSAACRLGGLFLGVCVVHALSVPPQREVTVLENLEEGGVSPPAVDATRRVLRSSPRGLLTGLLEVKKMVARELALVKEVCSTSETAAKQATEGEKIALSRRVHGGSALPLSKGSATASREDRDKRELEAALEELQAAAHEMVTAPRQREVKVRELKLLEAAAAQTEQAEQAAQNQGREIQTRTKAVLQSLEGDEQFATPTEARLIRKLTPCLHTVLVSQRGVSASAIRAATEKLKQSVSREMKALAPDTHPATHLPRDNFVEGEAHESLAAAVLRVEASVNKISRTAAQLQQVNRDMRVPHLKQIAKMMQIRKEGAKDAHVLESMQAMLASCV